MARLVLIARRCGQAKDNFSGAMMQLSKMLAPEKIPYLEPEIFENGGVCFSVLSPGPHLPIRNNGVVMGALFPETTDWNKPGAPMPDGSYAAVRWDRNTIEVLTDAVASRTIWFSHTVDCFIVSTSQRAIIFLLKSFEPDEEAFAWMLSSGTLGPGLSWDRRIRSVPPNAALKLNRISWKHSIEKPPVIFKTEKLPKRLHQYRLHAEIEKVIGHIRLDEREWVIPLSGGYDSRLLLLMLKDRYPGIHCVTWGTRKALGDPHGDAFIAKEVCRALGVRHTFFPVDLSPEQVETVFRRFVVSSEGRIDHISAYLDGFELWRALYENGSRGILRGDECFGSRLLISELDFRKFMLATMLNDYDEYAEMNLPPSYRQVWPQTLKAAENESLETWRDRVYAEYLFPYYLGALNELKLGYVEIIAPFAARRIIEYVRRIPDRWRNEKALYREIVQTLSPPVPYARNASIDLGRTVLKSEKVKIFLLDELNTAHARSILPASLLEKTEAMVHKNHAGPIMDQISFLRNIRSHLPPRFVKTIQRMLPLSERINYFDLALRCYIVSAATQLLNADALAGSSASQTIPAHSERKSRCEEIDLSLQDSMMEVG